MKKFAFLFFVSIALYTSAMAQTKAVKTNERVLKNTIKDKKEDRREIGKDVTHLKVKSAMRSRREVRRHRKSIHRQGEHLQSQGVQHPVKKAKIAAKAEKDAKNGRD